jgi:hypothetical protein
MTYTAHNPVTLYAAVVTRLAAQTSAQVGLGEAPTGAAKTMGTAAYAVVYPLFELFEGTLGDPLDTDMWTFQVTCIGGSAAHAQAMQHAARSALVGWSPTVTGFGTSRVRLVAGSGISRDDDVQPPAFYSTDRFDTFASPS